MKYCSGIVKEPFQVARGMHFLATALMAAVLLLLFPSRGLGQSPVSSPQVDTLDEESGEEVLEREMFFHQRRAGGVDKVIPPAAYEMGFQQSQRITKDKNIGTSLTALTNWVSVNPAGMFYSRTNANYISGRTNSIAFHPADPNTFYIAAAGGGIWKTTDGGLTFQALTDNLSALTSGSVAVDPTNANVVYVGTGELNYSLDSYYGDGVYKSTDAGFTWNKIATTAVGSYISTIVIDPQNTNIVYLAGSKGVYKSTNAGASWAYDYSGTYANSLVMDPTNSQTLYVSVGYYNANVIKKTTNGGATWTTLTSGLPTSGAARTTLAIAPSNSSILYASIANNTNYGLLGLYRTTNAGASWTLQNSSTNYLGGQGWYDNVVTVHPTNPDYVLVGGIDIYSSTNGGASLVSKTLWYSTSPSNFSHADIHYLGYNGSVLYCGSDGGVYKSADDGSNWVDLNRTISTLQFQSADYDPTNLLRFYGGTQDNDKEYTTNGGTDWIQRTTGDGGYTVVDPVTPNYIYGQYVGGSLHRSSNYGIGYAEISPSGSSGGLFYNPYEMAPGDHNTIVFGRSDVWKTTSAQTATSSSGWTQIATTAIVGSNVSAIGISASTTNKIYIGTSGGWLLGTTNNGAAWSTTSGFPYIGDLAVDIANDSVCYATCTGFDASRHVFRTTNSGAVWTNITGNLPNIPANSVVIRTASPRTLFVGTDLGVYKSTDEGTTWVSFNSGLPAVEVFDLKYKESTNLLLAATHGRGCFTFDLRTLATQRTISVNSSNPSSGVAVTVAPNDVNGQGNDSSPFIRTYYDHTSITLTAPATQSGNYFSKWTKNGVDLTVNQSVTVFADTNLTMLATYAASQTVTLAVTSSNPASGVSVTVSPSDNIGQGNGVTPFNRYYFTTGTASLTAPPMAGGNYFMKWQKNGVDYSASAAITINTDSASTMKAVYGLASVFQVSPASLSFGSVKTGHWVVDTVNVTNPGNTSLNISAVTTTASFFTVAPSSGSIPPAGSMKFFVTFTAPSGNTGCSGDLIFTHNAASSPDSVGLAGSSYSIFSSQPKSLAFGDIQLGTTKDDSLNVGVDTSLAMTLSSVLSDNSAFTITPSGGVATQGHAVTFIVSFHPVSLGPQSGNLVFTHDQQGSPDTVSVSGTGVIAGFSAMPTVVSFGEVVVSAAKTDSVVVSNPGSGQLTIASIVSNDSAEFSVTPAAPLSIPPAGSRKFLIQFTPTSLGAKSGQFIFSHNGPTSPDTVHASGDGVTVAFLAVPGDLSMGEVYVPYSAVDSFVVSNSGTGQLHISSIASDDTAEFSVTPSAPVSIPPLGNQKFRVRFTPVSDGVKAVHIVFTHNALSSPDTISVSAVGKLFRLVQRINTNWNLISVPIEVLNWSKIGVYPAAISHAFSFQGMYTSEDTLRKGYGYWLKFNGASADTFTGIPFTRDTINVAEGWNMIGSISTPVALSEVQFLNTALQSFCFGYLTAYYSADTLMPGNGYWMKVASNGQLSLVQGTGRGVFTTATLGMSLPGGLSSLIFKDADSKVQTLYFGKNAKDQGDLMRYALPPLPPEGGFDIRFASDRMVETVTEGASLESGIHISSAKYPLLVRWQLEGQTPGARLRIGDSEVPLTGNGSAVITGPDQAVMLVLAGSGALPREFNLAQNYPNPFNPVTTLKYGLPVESKVRLMVYDLFGQVVATLVDGVQAAGYKSVDWNAGMQASGVYFYRLEALPANDPGRTWTQIRKMLLIR